MLALLSHIGDRVSRLFGEPASGVVKTGVDGRDREELFGCEALASVLPFESYDPDHKLFIGPKSMDFVIEALPLVGGDDSCQTELLGLVEEVMKEGSSLQTLIWADPRISPLLDQWENARINETYRVFAAKRSSFLKEEGNGRVFRFILSYSMEIKDEASSAEREALIDAQRRMLKTLSGLTHAFVWDSDSFLTCVGDFLSYKSGSDVVRRSWNPYQPLSSQLTQGGLLEVDETHLCYRAEDTQFRSFRVVDYPKYWSLGAMQSLIGDVTRDAYRIETPFYIHYGVHLPSQEKADRSFKRRSQLIENQGKSRMLLRLVPDLADELGECDQIRRSVNQGSRYVQTQLSAGIWASGEELAQGEQALRSLFRINGFTLTPNSCLHLPMLLATLPMAWAEYIEDFQRLNLVKTTLSLEASNFFPIQGEWMGTPTPGMLLLGRRGQIINWNPFDNRSGNYNSVVVGRSGSGKSVFMQDLILSGLGTGARVYVLEVGRSFEKLCSSLGGQSIAFERDSSICLNPFTKISEEEEERLASFAMLKSVISCMASPTQGTSDFENALVERAISHAWTAKKNSATITDVGNWLLAHEDVRAHTLGTMLTPYCRGGLYARYFEGKNNVDFTHPMVLIELEELKSQKDLQAVVLQLCIMTIASQAFMGDRKTPFYICIDEAWDLMRAKQTESFIETLARRLRKYNGSLVIGTQSVDDFFETPGAKAAFENSDWMCFLAQKKGSIGRLVESGKLNMSEAMQMAMESVTTRHGEFSEVMICDADGNYSIARLLLDPFSQLLFSTKADEYAKLKELQAHGLSIVEAIARLLGQRRDHALA